MKKKVVLILAAISLLGQVYSQGRTKKTKEFQSSLYTFQEISIPIRVITTLPSQIYESSGMIVINENEFWTHEDSGNSNHLYCLDTTGQIIRTLKISNASNVDWEDIARDNQGRIYIADAGNNNNNRTNLVIYRIPDPATITGNTVNAEIIRFVFEDQTQFPPPRTNRNFDVEALIWHDDSLFMFTKNRSTPFNGYSKMYVLPASPGEYTAILVDSVFVGPVNNSGRVSAADIHPVTGELVLLTPTKMVSFSNYTGNRFFQGERIDYIFINTPGQNEGLAFVTPNRLYMTEEGSGMGPGLLYEIVIPASAIGFQTTANDILNLFPNPSSGLLIIESPWPESSKLEVFNSSGRLIHRGILGESRIMNTSVYTRGLYILVLEYNGRRIFRRWIRE